MGASVSAHTPAPAPAPVPAASLPPGRMGLPLIGETLAFLRNPFAFLEERRARHGNVFKSSIVGRRVVFLSGLKGAEAFYAPGNISRADAHPTIPPEPKGGLRIRLRPVAVTAAPDRGAGHETGNG